MEPVEVMVTGNENPQPGTESEWPANADVVRVTNNILDQIGCLASTGSVQEGHEVTVIPHTTLGAIVYGTADSPHTISYGNTAVFKYESGVWNLQ